MAQQEQLVLDRVTLAYHALKKSFVINEAITESSIQDLLVLYDVCCLSSYMHICHEAHPINKYPKNRMCFLQTE